MTDYTYHGARTVAPEPRDMASLANWAGAAVSLALVVGVGVWGYKVLARDVSGIPVVRATAAPMREAPENPGGTLADHQGLAVNRVADSGTAAPPADRLVLAPRPAGLSEDDVAQGLLASIRPRQSAPRPVAAQPAPDLSAPAMSEPIAPDDPIQALANQLAAGSTPLSELAPAEVPEAEQAALDTEIAPAPPPEEATAVEAPKPGPGLARSLRPHLRPEGIKTASLTSVAPDQIAAAVAQADANEIDAASLPNGTRLVQIGAFDSPETARAEWKRLEGRFGDYLEGKDRVIQKASSGGRTFYRLRAHGFEDLSDARRFCAAFVAQNVDCIPVVTR